MSFAVSQARRVPQFILCGLLLLRGVAALYAAPPKELREYDIKALFLLNMVQFVEWPDDAFHSATGVFRIGVLGEDPFGEGLVIAARGEKRSGRAVVVVADRSLQDLADCQVIFVCQSERGVVRDVLSRLANKPVLTVGDMPEFCRAGGIVNFYRDGDKVRFEVNRRAAENAGLKLGSQILRLARLVGEN